MTFDLCPKCNRPLAEHPWSKTYSAVVLFGAECAFNPDHLVAARVAMILEKDGYDVKEFEKFWGLPVE